MRIAPPSPFRQSAAALLADVRARLEERLPETAQSRDVADPAWIILEECAWMVEQLSAGMDSYPLAIVQQFLHLSGAQLLPAVPALGVVALGVARGGTLDWDPAQPAPLRLFVPQTEQSGLVEFAPVERGVTLRRMSFGPLSEVRDGELRRSPETPGPLVAWTGQTAPSRAFQRERLRFRFVAADPAALREQLTGAVARFAERGVGWLRLSVEDDEARGPALIAHVDPAAAFSAPGGLSLGGDLVGAWGQLDDTHWTPPVRVVDAPNVPARLRGRAPVPGPTDGTVVVPGVPPNLSIAGLFAPRAAPVPTNVALAVWATLTHLDTRLAAYRPTLGRVYAGLEPGEPLWIGAALDSELWFQLVPGPSTLLHVRLADIGAGRVRVGVVLTGSERLPVVRAYAEDLGGALGREPLPVAVAFRLSCPARAQDDGTEQVVALDVTVDAQTRGLLLVVEGSCAGVMANPMLVVQAPPVRDGREVRVERNVPEGVSLLHPDIVGAEVLARLVAEPLTAEARELVGALPLSRIGVTGQEPVVDFAGVALDPAGGQLTLNGIDAQGRQRSLRRGDLLRVEWYRRTDGARGNVSPGSIRIAEHERGPGVLITDVHNPLATFHGADRESDAAAMDRLFGPQDPTPVLPADFERLVRHALGARGEKWEVRVWTWAERALQSTALWPLPTLGEPADADRERFAQELASAGPETLAVALGPTTGELSAAELDWARRVVEGWCRRLSRRLPAVQGAVVGRWWPLTLETAQKGDLVLPAWSTDLDGVLVDARGRRAPAPRAVLLNAAICAVRRSAS